MRLFDIDENRTVQLNKAWILLIPEFAELFKRDKGSKGDYRGEKKLRTIAELTFIYFFTDFSSPLRDYDEEPRRKEALYYAGLEEKDLDEKVMAAQARYMTMQLEASRPLRTLKSLYKGLDALDRYFENLDFTKTDKQGKLLNDPTDTVNNAGKLKKMYDNIREFERMVEDDLKQVGTGIRGPNSTLGDQEVEYKSWSEQDIMKGSAHVAGGEIKATSSFAEVLKVTQVLARAEAEQSRELQPVEDNTERNEDEEDDE